MTPDTVDAPAPGPVIGVLTPLTAGMYFAGILKGISRAIVPEGGRVIAVETMYRPQLNEEYVFDPCFDQVIAWDHVDGGLSADGSVALRRDGLVADGGQHFCPPAVLPGPG